MKKKLILLACGLLLFNCATIQTKSLTKIDKETDEGFFYYLPKKHLSLHFTIEKSVPKKGVFSDIAECFGFDESEVIKSEKPFYKIVKITNSSRALPDVSQVYQLQLNQKFLNKTEFELRYSAEGELTGGSLESTDEILPLVNTVVNVAGSFFLGGNFQSGDQVSLADFDCAALDSNQSRYEKAKSTLNKIKAFNSSIADMLEGVEITMDLETKKYSHEQLLKLRNELLSKFTGKLKKQTEVLTFEIDPDDIPESGLEILHFDKSAGIETKLMARLDSKFIGCSLGQNKKVYKIKVKSKDQELKESIDSKTNIETGSFYYRLPVNASFEIHLNDKRVNYFEEQIPQWGSTLAVPETLEKIAFELYPGLGSLKTIGGISSTLNKEGLKELDSTLTSLKSKLKDNSKDILIEELEKDVKIKELQDKLNSTTGVQTEVSTEEDN